MATATPATATPALGQLLSDTLAPLADGELGTVIETLARCSVEISTLCRTGLSQKTSSTNKFGDEQLQLDVAADHVLMSALGGCKAVRMASSEETPTEVEMCKDGRFVVAFDPLDGSSIVGCNWAVGTIVGIWEAERIIGVSGKEMVGAVVTVYGPRTTMYVGLRDGFGGGRGGQRVVEYTLGLNGEWYVSLLPDMIKEGKLFAPANLRASQDNEGYRKLVEYYLKERYTLRYTGGMVPDVTQILVKGFGVFISPVSERARAKLRLVYEVMPMGMLIECAGGRSSDGKGSVLGRFVKGCDERSGVCLGSDGEVGRFEEFCGE